MKSETLKKDKSYYKAQAQKAAAKQFAGFHPKDFADEAIRFAQDTIATGKPHVIENFGEGGGQWRQHMAQHIDGTEIDATAWAIAWLDDAATTLCKAGKAGVEGAFPEMSRVMDFKITLLPPDEDEA